MFNDSNLHAEIIWLKEYLRNVFDLIAECMYKPMNDLLTFYEIYLGYTNDLRELHAYPVKFRCVIWIYIL